MAIPNKNIIFEDDRVLDYSSKDKEYLGITFPVDGKGICYVTDSRHRDSVFEATHFYDNHKDKEIVSYITPKGRKLIFEIDNKYEELNSLVDQICDVDAVVGTLGK